MKIFAFIAAIVVFYPTLTFAECSGAPDEEALDAYLKCKDKVSSAGGTADKALIINADDQKAWLIDKDGGNKEYAQCFDIAVGANSQNGDLGDVPGSNETPPGLLLTEPHDSDKYPASECLGLDGTSSDNKNTSKRGVIIHEANGNATAGCIGIKNGDFKKVKAELEDKGSPVFVYGKKMDESTACDGGGPGQRGIKKGGSGTVAWNISIPALIPEAMAAVKVGPTPGHKGSIYDFPIRKGAMIEIESYDKKTDTYRVRMPREEAVGPNITTPEYLKNSIKTLPALRDLQRSPSQIVGNQYKLDEQLTLLFESGVAKRKKEQHR